MRRVRAKLGGELIAPGDQRLEHALPLPPERAGRLGGVRSLRRLLHCGSHLLLHVLGEGV